MVGYRADEMNKCLFLTPGDITIMQRHHPSSRLGRRQRSVMILGLLLSAAFFSAALMAEADGPDHFRVVKVTEGDVLNLRAEPAATARKVGEIPPNASCLRNLDCRGGLTLKEFSTLNPEQRAERERQNPRWCKVEYRGMTGWVAGQFLAEGGCP